MIFPLCIKVGAFLEFQNCFLKGLLKWYTVLASLDYS